MFLHRKTAALPEKAPLFATNILKVELMSQDAVAAHTSNDNDNDQEPK